MSLSMLSLSLSLAFVPSVALHYLSLSLSLSFIALSNEKKVRRVWRSRQDSEECVPPLRRHEGGGGRRAAHDRHRARHAGRRCHRISFTVSSLAIYCRSFSVSLFLSSARLGQTFESEGDEEPDVQPGDLIFKIVTLPHPRFTRQGNDLHHHMTITLLEVRISLEPVPAASTMPV